MTAIKDWSETDIKRWQTFTIGQRQLLVRLVFGKKLRVKHIYVLYFYDIRVVKYRYGRWSLQKSRTVQFAGIPHKLTWSWMLSSKCVGPAQGQAQWFFLKIGNFLKGWVFLWKLGTFWKWGMFLKLGHFLGNSFVVVENWYFCCWKCSFFWK